MRILHISALPVWPIDGKGGMPSLLETLRGHVRAGYEMTVVLPRYQIFDDAPREVSIHDDEGFEIHTIGCRWAPALMAVRRASRRLGGGKEPPYLLRWLLNLSLSGLLTLSLLIAGLRLRFRRKLQFDLIYAHNQYAAMAGWLLGKILRAPNVTRLYGTFLADLMVRRFVALRYPTAAAGFLVPHSLLICGNDGTRGDVVARALGIDLRAFRFWQNGVDLPSQPPQCTREEIVAWFPASNLRIESNWIISCSRLSYWKRIDRILQALRVAVDAGCDCQVLLVGSGPEEERLRSLAKDLDLEPHVAWLGAVGHDVIWELMGVADTFIITNDVTNRCNPVYEAICAGLPIVSVSDSSTADLLTHGDNALLAEKDDIESLGQNLFRVLTDEDLRLSMIQAQSLHRQQLWSWRDRMEAEVAELEALVRRRCTMAQKRI